MTMRESTSTPHGRRVLVLTISLAALVARATSRIRLGRVWNQRRREWSSSRRARCSMSSGTLAGRVSERPQMLVLARHADAVRARRI
jgi:hypothetical protein